MLSTSVIIISSFMAENTSPSSAPVTTTSESDFLKSSSTQDTSNVYGDFFQETSDGTLSIWPKAQKSGIEILTTVLSYIVPVVAIVALVTVIHVFIRTREDSSFAENYQFLCPYINYGVELDSENKRCKTMTAITKEYQDKNTELQSNIVELLTEYIPIKISKNIIDASPEKRFIIETFANKVHPDEVIKQFDSVVRKAQYTNEKNIECNGINITNGDTIATQCTIYGGAIGDDDANRKLWSARIEALRLSDILWNTVESQFVFMNPPTTLTTEEVGNVDEIPSIFKTRVVLPVQLKYVPIKQEI